MVTCVVESISDLKMFFKNNVIVVDMRFDAVPSLRLFITTLWHLLFVMERQ